MDPLLQAILQSSQEKIPEWLYKPGEPSRPVVQDPLVGARRFAAPTHQTAQANTVRTALEGEYDDKTFAGKASRLVAKLLWGTPGEPVLDEQGRPHLNPERGMETALNVWNPVMGIPGIMLGKKAAETAKGKTLSNFLSGKSALERGEAPQAVWQKYKIGKTPEGDFVFEPPIAKGEREAIEQFSRYYPKETLKVLLSEGPREGYFHGPSKEVYAQGKGAGPITEFGSRRRVLEHELQHAADRVEGRSGGSNLQDPQYWNYAGEVRARNAETRLDPEERAWSPEMTEDIGRLEQVIKQGRITFEGAKKLGLDSSGGRL